jgi:hypothetical protein
MTTGSAVVVYDYAGPQPMQCVDQMVTYLTPRDQICYTELPCHHFLNVRATDILGHIVVLLFFADTLRDVEPARDGGSVKTGVARYAMVVATCPTREPEVMQMHVESIMTKTMTILSDDLKSKSTHVPLRTCNVVHSSDTKRLAGGGVVPHIVLGANEELHIEKDFMNCIYTLRHVESI